MIGGLILCLKLYSFIKRYWVLWDAATLNRLNLSMHLCKTLEPSGASHTGSLQAGIYDPPRQRVSSIIWTYWQDMHQALCTPLWGL